MTVADYSPARPDAPLDLRGLFRAAGGVTGERVDPADIPDRPEPSQPAELIDHGPARVDAAPLPVDAFLDGVQSALALRYRDHRPVHLLYAAAGGVDPSARPVAVAERLALVCGDDDEEWARDVAPVGVEVVAVAGDDPAAVERACHQRHGTIRAELERRVAASLLDDAGARRLVVDGALRGWPVRDELTGVVKTTGRRYLADESPLFGLPPGWRSARFRIPAGADGHDADRYSAYLRLVDAATRRWSYGLVRVEAYDPDLIDPLCATALAHRQRGDDDDPRGDRHLAVVRAVEEFLRSRRPQPFLVDA